MFIQATRLQEKFKSFISISFEDNTTNHCPQFLKTKLFTFLLTIILFYFIQVKIHICQVCTKTYRGRAGASNLRSHLLTAHGIGERKYKCECGEAFTWASKFSSHKKSCVTAGGMTSEQSQT